ncbi:hypothetical protein PV518_19615 [Streptomyces sp. ND04-05B]|uniref:hypothetical protein n=1 Tax=Streptomyces sp. ND04-05B TaxID=3028693 RepID=UPI0029A00F97|nr:hypothetical protein [Streptomyces sp. ND04-05B]MDX3064360.1 hypothetical protein [Streptomyces sp. ND04-05B]
MAAAGVQPDVGQVVAEFVDGVGASEEGGDDALQTERVLWGLGGGEEEGAGLVVLDGCVVGAHQGNE